MPSELIQTPIKGSKDTIGACSEWFWDFVGKSIISVFILVLLLGGG
jgi:hypothetical protein